MSDFLASFALIFGILLFAIPARSLGWSKRQTMFLLFGVGLIAWSVKWWM